MQIDSTANSLAAVWQKMAQLEQAAASISSQIASFKEELQQAAGAAGTSSKTTTTPMSSAASATTVVTNPTVSSVLAQSVPSSGTRAVTTDDTSGTSLKDKVQQALDAQLLASGVDPSTLSTTYWEQDVYFPGGGYIHRSISVRLPDGHSEVYDADLTLLSPHVTVDDLLYHLSTSQQASSTTIS